MEYTWKLSEKFSSEFVNLNKSDQDKIIDFTDIYEQYGLTDFSKFEGKISPSWSGSDMSQDDYDYAKGNHLWHYHIGIPYYEAKNPKYKTSDWVLHFQWPDQGKEICLVDLYRHYLGGGEFYLPPDSYLGNIVK